MTWERKPSAVSLQRGMGEVRRTDREGRAEGVGVGVGEVGLSSAHPGSDS